MIKEFTLIYEEEGYNVFVIQLEGRNDCSVTLFDTEDNRYMESGKRCTTFDEINVLVLGTISKYRTLRELHK